MNLESKLAIKPMLCKLEEQPFNRPDYIWEPKLDGERLIVVMKDGKVKGMYARSGREKAFMYPDLKLATSMDCVLDGEVVSVDNTFNGIQHRSNRLYGIEQAVKDYPVKYSVFDVLQIGEVVVCGVPLETRKELLQHLLTETDNVSMTPWVQDGVKLFETMKANKLEGVVGKSLSSTYQENKRGWLKVKCWQEGMFVAVGYTEGTGWRSSTFGALVLSDAKGNYVGSVGSGFTEKTIREICKLFGTGSCPFVREPEKATWIKPFPVRIKYLEFSNDGMLRFPVFKGVVNG